jgi:hypothetical protein
MNLLNKYVSFSVLVILKAVRDYLNFQVEYNTGFFSLTDGFWDAWHLCGWLMFLIIGIQFVWNKSKWQDNMLRLGALGVIAFCGQLLFYNFLFKL